MTYFFETYGCQMNKAESASIEQLFIARGWIKAEYAETADIVVINTCSVRITAETRIHGRLGYFSALKKERLDEKYAAKMAKKNHRTPRTVAVPQKPLTIVVTGCMAERLKNSLKRDFPAVDYVVGTFQKNHFEEIIDAHESANGIVSIKEEAVYSFAPLSYEMGSFQAFVPIMHGCNNFCSYCIVPYVRGREISRPVADILNEIDLLSSHKVKEITVLGQNVNSYNADSTGFAQLLQIITNHLEKTNSSIEWVRFMTSHPKDVSKELIDVIAKENRLCKHIHLAVQNGSTRVLQAMNRKYTREDFLSLVDDIRKKIPNISLSTDLLVGFPGETDEDFLETISLMQIVQFDAAYMYYYNPREGTVAYSMANQVPLQEKKRRVALVIETQQEITRKKLQSRIGATEKVLVEAISHDNKDELLARTERDERLVFKGDSSLIGNFARVTLEELNGNTFRAKLVTL